MRRNPLTNDPGDRRIAPGDADDPDHICDGRRSSRRGLCCERCPPERASHRLHGVGTANAGQMVRVAHGDRPGRQTGRYHVQSRYGSLCHSIFAALIRGSGPIVQGGADCSAHS